MPHGKLPTKVLRRDALSVPPTLPTDTMCLEVTIPNDPHYLINFVSIVGLLGKWNSYRQDGAHQAADVAQLWRNVLADFPIKVCGPAEITGGTDDEDGDMLRVNPDNPCELQVFCAGKWEHFWGPDDCPALGGAQNPTGGGLVGPGSCKEYSGTLEGQSVWLLPVPVSPGDTVQITHIEGAWTDGSGLWYCPDGQHYIANVCADGITTSGGDPLPTAPHAALIFKSDGNYYNALNGPVGILAGSTPDSNVEFQMNDPSLSGNGGTIAFKVQVCKQAEAPVGLAYFAGTGPGTVNFGDTIVVDSTNIGGGNWDVDITFSVPVKLSVVGVSTFSELCGAGVVFSEWFHPVGTSIGTLVSGTNTQPTEFPSPTVVDRWYCATCVGASPYTVTLKVERP